MNEKRVVHDYGQISNSGITSMAATLDNKTLFVCANGGDFREFDISLHKEVKNFDVKNAIYCVVTCNNQFLITAERRGKASLSKWSIQTKQQLHKWKSNFHNCVES